MSRSSHPPRRPAIPPRIAAMMVASSAAAGASRTRASTGIRPARLVFRGLFLQRLNLHFYVRRGAQIQIPRFDELFKRRNRVWISPLAQRKQLLPFLDQVQSRREFPTRVTQAVQITAQNRVIGPLLQSSKPLKAPFILKLLQQFPVLQRIPARAVGIGARAEHVRTVDAHRGEALPKP